MRKLLVASQKGGVGKTTTSMNLAAAVAAAGSRVLLLDADPLSSISNALNLAQHARRRPLRPDGIDLPGVLVTDVVPGLDILSPYEDGTCSDDDMDHLLRALSSSACEGCYGCLIIDAPPFMGANPGQLVGCCDDLLLVMRAEPMAHRTLPAFLELVQRSRRREPAIDMRGILLTLPESEEPGGRWERELRGRFGNRILAEVIPHDETIDQSLQVGQIGSHANPDSPAGRQYRLLGGKLGLTEEGPRSIPTANVLPALREAAASVPANPAPRPATPPMPAAEPAAALTASPAPRAEATPRRMPIPPPVTASVRKKSAPSIPRTAPAADKPAMPAGAPVLADPKSVRPAVRLNARNQRWPLWILLGALLGGSLRFLPVAGSLLPFVVGLGVALVVVLVLRYLVQVPVKPTPPPADKARPRSSQDHKKPPSRPGSKKDVGSRLAALTHGPRSGHRTPRD